MWRFGRSNSATQQAAVMLYVHKLMGDGAPGEVTSQALSSGTRAMFRRIQREVKRHAGPYRVRATLPEGMVAGREAAATTRTTSS
jgi:hypothetical protein